jgi:hypothetical protein
VNYAALLAVLVLLGLAFPILVRVAQANGVSQAGSIIAAMIGATFVLAWFLIRQRVANYRANMVRIERIKQQLEARPGSTEAFFDDNEHVGDLLIRVNRRREALAMFERYLALEGQAGRTLPGLEIKIAKLKTHLDE